MSKSFKLLVTPPQHSTKKIDKNPFGLVVTIDDFRINKSPFHKWAVGAPVEEVIPWYLAKGYTIEVVRNFDKVNSARGLSKQQDLPGT